MYAYFGVKTNKRLFIYLFIIKSAYGTPGTRFWVISDTWQQVKVHMGHLAPGSGVSKTPGTK